MIRVRGGVRFAGKVSFTQRDSGSRIEVSASGQIMVNLAGMTVMGWDSCLGVHVETCLDGR
jgi:hypothetical protein